jgi:hypothetical protein
MRRHAPHRRVVYHAQHDNRRVVLVYKEYYRRASERDWRVGNVREAARLCCACLRHREPDVQDTASTLAPATCDPFSLLTQLDDIYNRVT